MGNDAKERIKFWLNGCDISFIAEAPADITLKQLLEQCDKIKPDYCACGIRTYREEDEMYQLPVEIQIDYDDIRKVDKYAACTIEKYKKIGVKE